MSDTELLNKLINLFYIDMNGHMTYKYREDIPISEIDGNLESEVKDYIIKSEWLPDESRG